MENSQVGLEDTEDYKQVSRECVIMTEIVAIKYAEPEPSGLAEIENIREFFKLNKYIWDEDSGVLSNGSESCIFSFLGPFSLFKENDIGDVFPDVVFNYIVSLSDKDRTIVSMIEEDDSGWTMDETLADFYLKDFEANLRKEVDPKE